MEDGSEDTQLVVVLIDDEEMVRLNVSNTLRHEGWSVISLGNEPGVSFSVVKAKPNIILLDLDMPGLTGEDLIGTLHGAHGLPDTPVLFFSGLPEAELAERVRHCGADGYISKDTDMAELNGILRSYLESIEA